MKLKEKLAREYVDILVSNPFGTLDYSDISDAYMEGFEKAREMFLELWEKNDIQSSEVGSSIDISHLGEEEE